MDEVECPYCEECNEVDHDDGLNYEEGEITNHECRSCDKMFQVSTSISFYHEGHKADCLNGDVEHDWKQQIGFPKALFVGRFHCAICGKTKVDLEANRKAMEEYDKTT